MQPMINAAVALPEPLRLGSLAMILLASSALKMDIGPRIMPKQNIPMIAYFRASPASEQALPPSMAGTFVTAIFLHLAQYGWPEIVTRQLLQKDSAQPAQRLAVTASGWLMQGIEDLAKGKMREKRGRQRWFSLGIESVSLGNKLFALVISIISRALSIPM